jgi:hypothetical protein
MLDDESLELGHERRVSAEAQFRLDPFLQPGEPQLLEAFDLDLREWLEGEVAERWAAP